MQTVEAFINDLGGTVEVATALELTPSTVSSWKTAGSIPKWRMDGIKKLAKRKGIEVPDSFARPQGAAA
jgi:hypothetical protein